MENRLGDAMHVIGGTVVVVVVGGVYSVCCCLVWRLLRCSVLFQMLCCVWFNNGECWPIAQFWCVCVCVFYANLGGAPTLPWHYSLLCVVYLHALSWKDWGLHLGTIETGMMQCEIAVVP